MPNACSLYGSASMTRLVNSSPASDTSATPSTRISSLHTYESATLRSSAISVISGLEKPIIMIGAVVGSFWLILRSVIRLS